MRRLSVIYPKIKVVFSTEERLTLYVNLIFASKLDESSLRIAATQPAVSLVIIMIAFALACVRDVCSVCVVCVCGVHSCMFVCA